MPVSVVGVRQALPTLEGRRHGMVRLIWLPVCITTLTTAPPGVEKGLDPATVAVQVEAIASHAMGVAVGLDVAVHCDGEMTAFLTQSKGDMCTVTVTAELVVVTEETVMRGDTDAVLCQSPKGKVKVVPFKRVAVKVTLRGTRCTRVVEYTPDEPRVSDAAMGVPVGD